MIGKKQGDDYLKIDHRLEMPQNCPNKVIKVVQLKVNQHLDSNSLGCPHKQRTAADVWAEIAACQGAEVQGHASIALQDAVTRLHKLKTCALQPSRPPLFSAAAAATLKNELEAERARAAKLEDEIKDLQLQLKLLKTSDVGLQNQLQTAGATTLDDENDPDMLPKRSTQQSRSGACNVQ